MLTYNTLRARLPLPEYGRTIQKMVDHCLTIEDRTERTRCANTIINCMSKLFPKIKEQDNYEQKLWDHLAIMSGFKLDIDYPMEVVSSNPLATAPDKINYPGHLIRYRHYGHEVEKLINRAMEMEPGDELEQLKYAIASHMKKLLLATRPDGVTDAKVFRDLAEYSHGMLTLSADEVTLPDFKIIAPPANGKKKKKR